MQVPNLFSQHKGFNKQKHDKEINKDLILFCKRRKMTISQLGQYFGVSATTISGAHAKFKREGIAEHRHQHHYAFIIGLIEYMEAGIGRRIRPGDLKNLTAKMNVKAAFEFIESEANENNN